MGTVVSADKVVPLRPEKNDIGCGEPLQAFMQLDLDRDADEPWHHVMAEAAPRDHIVQLYQDQGFLNRAVCRFAGAALSNGEGIISAPTLPHWNAIRPRLEAEGVDVDAARQRGQLTVVDADATPAALHAGRHAGFPVFLGVAGEAIAKARGGGHYSKVRWWGEMVNVLWERGDVAASMNLEDLFDQLAHKHDIAIFCSFLMDNFNGEVDYHTLPRLGENHFYLIPVEDLCLAGACRGRCASRDCRLGRSARPRRPVALPISSAVQDAASPVAAAGAASGPPYGCGPRPEAEPKSVR